jgi:hypothetical protein
MIPLISQAISWGYTASQVLKFISSKVKGVDKSIKSAQSHGYSDDDILKFLGSKIKTSGKSDNSQLTPNQQYLKRQGFKTKQEKEETRNKYISGAMQLGAGALGTMALTRALPQTAQSIIPEVEGASNAMSNPVEQIASKAIPEIDKEAIQNISPIEIPKLSPFPEVLQKQASAMVEAGNTPDQIEAALKSINPKIVKEYEKATKTPIKSAIEEFSKSVLAKHQTQPMEKGIQEATKPIETKISEPVQPIEENKEMRKKVALPNGDIGEITNIRQGIATVNSNGREYRRKVEELIDAPIPEKDLADLHSELMKGIESKTGEDISRMVNWAGYDPKTNELAFVPHLGALYIYDNISPEDAKQLTNVLAQRKSSGENFIGAWGSGTKSPIGAEMSKLIQKLQKERGGKGNEYKGKYEKIYDAIEPAKLAAKQKHEEKKEEIRKEKQNVKKRKAKKPRFD